MSSARFLRHVSNFLSSFLFHSSCSCAMNGLVFLHSFVILSSQAAAAVAVVTLCALLAAGGGARAAPEGCRKHVARLTDDGAVGDGRRLNTAAFAKAVADLSARAGDGGAALVVPRGRWLTGPFNLTSHFTLFLDEGAEILASQVSPASVSSHLSRLDARARASVSQDETARDHAVTSMTCGAPCGASRDAVLQCPFLAQPRLGRRRTLFRQGQYNGCFWFGWT
jgi:hypothetical protein